MCFRDKKFYGCRHHLVQLVLSVNSHNHFPSRLYLRSSCQASALFSSQEPPDHLQSWEIERCNNNPSGAISFVLLMIFKLRKFPVSVYTTDCLPLPTHPVIVTRWGVKISGEPVNGAIRYKQDILLLSSPSTSNSPLLLTLRYLMLVYKIWA